ncbi:MAG: WbqC family protein [Dysgonamonadaceae bacterium]|jgi:hypothetical protein|nr:WbqC family protein [Dysgonamonadaceae bacterium]
MLILSSFCLAPVEYYREINIHRNVIIERNDNYVKQTYRNRYVIAAANGLQTLTVPVVKPGSPKCLTKDIRVAEHGNWRHIHWNSIISAYSSTPFFEYYADDFHPFYEKKYNFLFDFNEELRETVCMLLDISPQITYSHSFIEKYNSEITDLREMINPKRTIDAANFPLYYQNFAEQYGFQPNLSIIDLLFNTGNESILYLR